MKKLTSEIDVNRVVFIVLWMNLQEPNFGAVRMTRVFIRH